MTLDVPPPLNASSSTPGGPGNITQRTPLKRTWCDADRYPRSD